MLEQFGKGLVIVIIAARRPFRKRTAKCSGYPGLVGHIVNSDQSSFHRMIACGVLIRFQ
ncbi:MAG: hypothetical protein LH485_03225 [Sphingomonas bacterium]|nr:hypothetical protein [Sphingomonas bacterium]